MGLYSNLVKIIAEDAIKGHPGLKEGNIADIDDNSVYEEFESLYNFIYWGIPAFILFIIIVTVTALTVMKYAA